MAKNKHLTDAERLQIEHWLKDKSSIKQIAKWLDKSTSTISREIRKRALSSDKYAPYHIRNRCIKKAECQRRYLCEDKPNCTKRCSLCNLCNVLCDEFEEQVCDKLCDPPYVCNHITSLPITLVNLILAKNLYYLTTEQHTSI